VIERERIRELERIERAAFRSLWKHAPRDVAQEHGLVTEEVAGATCVVFRDAPTTMLNRAFGVGVARAATAEDVEAITSFFAGRTPRFAIGIAPIAQPESLTELLSQHGFASAYAWMKFERATDDVPDAATELTIDEVRAERGRDFGVVVAEAFGLPASFARWWTAIANAPGWHCFVGYDGTEPAAAGALYVDGGAAWLGAAGTRPQFRGRGGQGAILAARLGAAKRLGAEIVATETGERVDDRPSGSYRNILRAGFTEAYLRPNYERDAIALS
jgi:GNAT superfamily N-acetyltransferase